MNAILARIERIVPASESHSTVMPTYDITAIATAIFPDTRSVPAWLADKQFTITRVCADVRELGRPGDALPLTVAESAPLLEPLVATLSADAITLSWRMPEPPAEWRVSANGRTATGAFTSAHATVSLSDLAAPGSIRQVSITVTAGKATINLPHAPLTDSAAYAVTVDGQARVRAQSPWYTVDYATEAFGGAIAAIRERGRDVDHLGARPDRIAVSVYDGCYMDRLRSGWSWDDRLKSVAAKSIVARRTPIGTRVAIDAVVDDGQSFRTAVAFQLHDALPLISYDREYTLGPAKPPEADKPHVAKSPIDELVEIGTAFRCGTRLEEDKSRILAMQGDILRTYRITGPRRPHEPPYPKIANGWTLTEHPDRRQWMLHLIDPASSPTLAMNRSADTLVLEPHWPRVSTKPGDGTGYSVGIAAGERAGASADGVWLAARHATPTGIAVGIVARLRPGHPDRRVTLSVAGQSAETKLNEMVTNFGPVQCATIDIPHVTVDDPISITVAGIAERSAS